MHAVTPLLNRSTAKPSPSHLRPCRPGVLSASSRTRRVTVPSHSTDARRHYAHGLGLRAFPGLFPIPSGPRPGSRCQCALSSSRGSTARFARHMRRGAAPCSRSREAAAHTPTRPWPTSILPLRRASGPAPSRSARCCAVPGQCTLYQPAHGCEGRGRSGMQGRPDSRRRGRGVGAEKRAQGTCARGMAPGSVAGAKAADWDDDSARLDAAVNTPLVQ